MHVEPTTFFKTSKNIEKNGEKFSISQYSHLMYRSELKDYVIASYYIDDTQSVIFEINKRNESMLFPED